MTTADELWELLPAVYRIRDSEPEQGGVLRALVEVLAAQAEVVEQDLAHLYDNWFVETCAPWVVPYLGDLVGARPLHRVDAARATPRAYVANTLRLRRRKGTIAVLEQVARDVTGWPARATELYRQLAWSQHVNHRRPGSGGTIDLRSAAALELADGPFDRSARTPDVRAPQLGRPNIPDVALAVWRLAPFDVTRATARAVADPPDGRYTFDPTGRDVPLVNPPIPEEDITSLAGERHVPAFLRRRALHDELEGVRAGAAPPGLPYFGTDPVVTVYADTGAGLVATPPAQLTAADLSDPPPQVTTGWRRPGAPVLAAVDPVLGRLAFAAGTLPTRVEVAYTYAAPGPVGAGSYDRGGGDTEQLVRRATFVRAVGLDLPARPGTVVRSVSDAVADWGTPAAGTIGVIAVLDDRTYDSPGTVTVPAGCTLVIAAGVWPDVEDAPVAGVEPSVASLQLDDRRPVLVGELAVRGGPRVPPQERGRLVVDGLVVEGHLTVRAGDLGRLDVRHCTVLPGRTLRVTAGNADLTVDVDRSILGAVDLPAAGPRLLVRRSVVDADLDAGAAETALDAVTVLGGTACRTLHASDCLFVGDVAVERTQEGCVRYSYVRAGARTPRRHRCQPDLALRRPGAVAATERARLTPQLDATRYGDPAYARLSDRSAPELLTGSSLGSDIGCYADLLRPQREANLRVALEEYLPAPLTAGLVHAT
jgi:hypothetical protein